MTDDETPPDGRPEISPRVPDTGEPGRVAVDRQAPDDSGPPRPPAAREPDDETLEGRTDASTLDDAGPSPSQEPGSGPGQEGTDLATEPNVVGEEDGKRAVAGEDTTGLHDPSGARHHGRSAEDDRTAGEPEDAQPEAGAAQPGAAQLLPGDPQPQSVAPPAVARGRLGHAMRPRATRAQLLAGALCALLGFALVVQARQTQTQGLDALRQADLVRLLDNVTNAEARAEQDVRDEQAIRDRLLSGTDSSAAAQQAARQRLETLGLLAGTVPASGPGIELEITDPRRQVDASILLDTLEELRDGGAEVVQIGSVRVVAATAFTDEADGVRVDGRLLTPPYTFKIIGDPQTLSRLLQIPGGVLDVLHSKGAQGKVTQPATVTVDALRSPTRPQYARPAPGATP